MQVSSQIVLCMINIQENFFNPCQLHTSLCKLCKHPDIVKDSLGHDHNKRYLAVLNKHLLRGSKLAANR